MAAVSRLPCAASPRPATTQRYLRRQACRAVARSMRAEPSRDMPAMPAVPGLGGPRPAQPRLAMPAGPRLNGSCLTVLRLPCHGAPCQSWPVSSATCLPCPVRVEYVPRNAQPRLPRADHTKPCPSWPRRSKPAASRQSRPCHVAASQTSLAEPSLPRRAGPAEAIRTIPVPDVPRLPSDALPCPDRATPGRTTRA